MACVLEACDKPRSETRDVCYLTMMTVKWDYVATVKDENEYGALVE
jgi:hypothetical protein